MPSINNNKDIPSAMTLTQKIYGLLNIGDHVSARNVVKTELAKLDAGVGDEKIINQSKLYGFLIDIGNESQTESDLTEAISFMKVNQVLLSNGTSKPYYYYNLANAVDGAARIFYFHNRGIHQLDVQKQRLQESIQYYWTALNSVSNDHNLRVQISINLSSALIVVGRGVEAVQFQDEVLAIAPKYPQALISRADHLSWIWRYTNCAPTVAMFMQIHHNYDDGINTTTLPPHVLQRTTAQRALLRKEIEDRGFTLADSKKEISETKMEFSRHTPYRKYCIQKYLTLNEHGIYCGCVANEKDDLRIGVHFGAFRSEVLPKLELLLNRLKSEFAFARWSYYNSLDQEMPLEFDVLYSDLLENEVITPKMELMRSSFRICYGILDKIALGVCKLFNVPAKRIH
ncbi:MAG TPA: LA2681 family HEPN domain-containing protein, partial [Mucilaginibacter sp.]